MNELPFLDLTKLKQNLSNDQDVFTEIAKAMCDDITQRGARLQQAAQSRDVATIKQETHAFKGGLGSVTAVTAASLAADLERMATTAQWNDFDIRLTLFYGELEKIFDAFEQELMRLNT